MVDAMVNDYVNSEIVCTLAALGYTEDNEYYKGDDCLGEGFRLYSKTHSHNYSQNAKSVPLPLL